MFNLARVFENRLYRTVVVTVGLAVPVGVVIALQEFRPLDPPVQLTINSEIVPKTANGQSPKNTEVRPVSKLQLVAPTEPRTPTYRSSEMCAGPEGLCGSSSLESIEQIKQLFNAKALRAADLARAADEEALAAKKRAKTAREAAKAAAREAAEAAKRTKKGRESSKKGKSVAEYETSNTFDQRSESSSGTSAMNAAASGNQGALTARAEGDTDASRTGSSISAERVPNHERFALVDDALADLRSANVAFNTPTRAKAGKSFVIEAALSAILPPSALSEKVTEPGKIEVAPLQVSNRLAATLSGGGFDISPSGPQEQWVSGSQPTTWTWTVTPKAAGEQQVLILKFDALIKIAGSEDWRTINTFKRLIDVDVSWPETPTEWLEWLKKTGENLSWIWATVLIPIAGGVWAWVRGKKPDGDDQNRSKGRGDPPSANAEPSGHA